MSSSSPAPPTPALIDELSAAKVPLLEKRTLGMRNVRCGSVTTHQGDWFVCRANQDPGRARLLDVAVRLRGQREMPCLAVLEPPANGDRRLDVTDEYLRAYQSIAWHVFGIALVVDSPGRTFAVSDVSPTDAARAEFEVLVTALASALHEDARTAADGTRWMVPEDSREAEALVRITCNRVLRPRGFRREIDGGDLGKKYSGFWRRAEADGVWTCKEGLVRAIALESKLNEDSEAPLCQVVDHLAHVTSSGRSGGVVGVRVHLADRVPRIPSTEIKQIEHSMLVRYFNVVVQ